MISGLISPTTMATTTWIPTKAFWNSGREEKPNLGYKPRYKEGYFPVQPMDSLQDIRSEMVLALEEIGVKVEVHHHEVSTAGQCEIDMRFDTLTSMGDKLMKYKYVVKNVARRHGKTATLMPKPIFQDNGSGMHVHQSIWKGGKNVFYEAGGYADLSKAAIYYIGGMIKHAAALLAFCAPTTNSYRRLVPGYEAPINLIYSQRNRSAAFEFQPTRAVRRPNVWRFGFQIHPATAIWLSARCSWRDSMEFRTRSCLPTLSTRTLRSRTGRKSPRKVHSGQLGRRAQFA